LIEYCQLDSSPGLKEVQLGSIEVRFDELMNALASRRDHIFKVKTLINPSFDKPRFVEVKPCFDNIGNLPDVGGSIALFELLKPVFKCLLVCRCHELMPFPIKVLPLLVALRLSNCIVMAYKAWPAVT
jgi:hypothetical protein